MSDLYNAEYWQAMDGGNGVQDSIMWQDIAFLLHHLFAYSPDGSDLAGEFRHLDLGCGYGYLSRHMQRRGIESWGLDISRHALESAPDDIKSHLQWFDMTKPDISYFGREFARLLTCIETLEHVATEQAPQALKHIWTLLRPGGYAFLAICVEGRPGADSDPTHVNVVPREWWEPVLERQGFVRDYAREDQIKEYHLFSHHGGVFIVQKPYP